MTQPVPAGYGDYWPEPFAAQGALRLFFTSEAPVGSAPAGTGHIWTTSSRVQPTDKDQCKNGGYAAFGFANQGACVSSTTARK